MAQNSDNFVIRQRENKAKFLKCLFCQIKSNQTFSRIMMTKDKYDLLLLIGLCSYVDVWSVAFKFVIIKS